MYLQQSNKLTLYEQYVLGTIQWYVYTCIHNICHPAYAHLMPCIVCGTCVASQFLT